MNPINFVVCNAQVKFQVATCVGEKGKTMQVAKWPRTCRPLTSDCDKVKLKEAKFVCKQVYKTSISTHKEKRREERGHK